MDRRERTVAEVRGYLEAKGVDPAVAEQAIAAIAEQGYLDDRRFARLFVSDKRRLEHWGRERIRGALRARGVDPELVEVALGEDDDEPAFDPHEPGSNAAEPRYDPEEPGSDPYGPATHPPELRRALALLARRYPGPFDDDRERNRALGLLLRKGYDSELAYDALRVHSGRS